MGTPFKMKGHELPGPNQRNSPAKQHEEGHQMNRKKGKLQKMTTDEFDSIKSGEKKQAANWNKKLERLSKRRKRKEEKGKSTERVQRKINKEYYKLNPRESTPQNTTTKNTPKQPSETNPKDRKINKEMNKGIRRAPLIGPKWHSKA